MDIYGVNRYMFLFLLSNDKKENCGVLAVPGIVPV